MWERGAALFHDLLNGTAGNQVLDDPFCLYKGTSADVIDKIVCRRIAAYLLDPTVKVNLDFCDLGEIINLVDQTTPSRYVHSKEGLQKQRSCARPRSWAFRPSI